MGEPETLDTAEPLGDRIARHSFDRLIMLSDGVFAIAITLLALEIKPPNVWDGGILTLLISTWRSLFGFGLSFVLVGYFWLSHKWIFARLRRVDNVLTGLTLLLLIFVVLAPFMTQLVAMNGPLKAMRAYSAFFSIAFAVQAALYVYAAFIGKLLFVEILRGERILYSASLAALPLLFASLGVLVRPGMTATAFVPFLAAAVIIRFGRGWWRRRLQQA